MNALLLRRLLERTGFRVSAADNGAKGVAMFQTWQPHFIWDDFVSKPLQFDEISRSGVPGRQPAIHTDAASRPARP